MNEFKKLFFYTRGNRVQFSAGILGKGINALLSTYFMAILLGSVTRALTIKTSTAVISAILEILPLLAVVFILQLYPEYLVKKTCLYAAMSMRKNIVHRILGSEVGSLNGKNSSDVIAAFTSDIPTAFDNMADIVSVPVKALFLGLGGFIYILLIDINLAFLTLGFGMLILVYSLFFARWMRTLSNKVLEGRSTTTKHVKELLDGFVTIHMFLMQNVVTRRYQQVVNNVKKNSIIYGSISGLLGGVNNGVSNTFSKLLLFLAGLIVFSGKFDVPTLLIITQMAGGVAGVFNVSRILTDTQAAINGAKRVFDIMDVMKPEKSMPDDTSVFSTDDNKPIIQFEDVSFSYTDYNNIISNCSFMVDKNCISILIGESGSGKTTILRLLEALYTPNSGNIYVNGKELKQWDYRKLRENMAYVPQDPLLFEGTITYNIMMGSNTCDQNMVIKAAQQAGIHDFIETLPEKYNTKISEGGLSLSGGERQRVALARAFYREAPVLILDEVTSSVDAKTESIIYECLKEYKKNHTILFSTHKESAYTIADNIFKVETGRLLKM